MWTNYVILPEGCLELVKRVESVFYRIWYAYLTHILQTNQCFKPAKRSGTVPDSSKRQRRDKF